MQFHETLIGHRILGSVVPSMAATLERIASSLETIEKQKTTAPGFVTISIPFSLVGDMIGSLSDAADLCTEQRNAASDVGEPDAAESWHRDEQNLDILARLLGDTIHTNGSRKDPEQETKNEPTA